MKVIKQLILSLIIGFLIIPNIASSQEGPCVCSSYNSLKYRDTYEDIFQSNKLRELDISEVVVYNRFKDSAYTEVKFKFDKNGSIFERMEYYKGNPSMIHEFERDLSGKIIQASKSYVDSNEVKNDFFPTEIVDFIYDSKNRLIMSKNRDIKGNIVPDNRSEYTKIEYDDLNRITGKTNFSYFRNDKSYSLETKYVYSNKLYSAKYVTNYNGKQWLKGDKTFDDSWRVLRNKSNGLENDPALFDELFDYNNQGRIIKFESITKGNYADECPENGNFTDLYYYDARGLLEKISHTFNDVVCELRFEYLK